MMERFFVNKNFKYIHVVPISNGITWTVERLCSQITTLYKAAGAYNKDVIVWLDRETRAEGSEDIYLSVVNSLTEIGISPGRIHVLVSDRMTENIILADEALMVAEMEDLTYTYELEGRNGKRFLKEYFRAKGIAYRETIHGVALLKKTRLSRSAIKSPSVQRFLGTFTYPCWWI